MYKNARYPEFMENLTRARQVLAGFDEEGNPSHPHQFDDGVLSFADGEGIRRPHPSVVSAGLSALMETKVSSLEKYFFLKRFEDLDNMITKMFIEEGIGEENAQTICISTGTSHLFNAFFYSVSTPGDVFLTAPGYYHSLANWCHINAVELQCVQTQNHNDYKLTVADLEAWDLRQQQEGTYKKAKGIILFNPTYTGAVYSESELFAISKYVSKHNIVVIEDSIFMYTMFDENDPIHHLANFDEVRGRVVTVNGSSKAYGLANMRVGWAVGPESIISKMNFYTGATQVDAPHVSKVMALAALQAPNDYLLANRRELQKRAQLVCELVDEANLRIQECVGFIPSVPFLKILQIPRSGHSILLSLNGLQGMKMDDGNTIKDSIDVTRYFLSNAKICFSPGLSMGFTDCTVRISYGCVGLGYTYESTQTIELTLVLKEIMGRFNTDISFEKVMNMLGLSAEEISEEYTIGQETSFERGRELIREGIINRMVPAVVDLVSKNRDRVLV